MNPAASKVAFWTVVALTLASSVIYLAVLLWHGAYADDYPVFWSAARLATDHPERLYDFDYISKLQGRPRTDKPWPYPPSTLLLFLPFAALPLWLSYGLFVLLSVTAYWLAARRVVSGWSLALAMASLPVVTAAVAGQPTLIVAAITITALLLLRSSQLLPGLLLAVAAALKPSALLVAPIALAAGGYWVALLVFVSTLASVALAASLVADWGAWVAAVPRFYALAAELNLLERSVTPSGLAAVLGLPSKPLQLIGIGGGLALAVWAFRRPQTEARAAGLVLGSLLCAPYAMGHELAMFAPFASKALMDGAITRSLTLSGLAGMFAVPLVAAASVLRPPHAQVSK